MRTHFITPKGTSLPILNLKGKEYLQVAYRLVWFREEHPDWSLETSFVAATDKYVKAKAEITNESGRTMATAHKVEHYAHFPDADEKAETGAIGRALGFCGFGTQFAPEILKADDDADVVDAPLDASKAVVESAQHIAQAIKEQSVPVNEPLKPGFVVPPPMKNHAPTYKPDWSGHRKSVTGFDPGDFKLTIKKYFNKEIRTVPSEELRGYSDWMFNQSVADKKPMTEQFKQNYCFIKAYLEQHEEMVPPPPPPEEYIPF